MTSFNQAIILAAGKGTRMKVELPKCAVSILGKPMIKHIVDACITAGISKIVVIVGYKKEVIIDILKDYSNVVFAEQVEQLGTGHACLMGLPYLNDDVGSTIIINGDMPCVGSVNIKRILDVHANNHFDMTVTSCIFDNPFSYGRIVKDSLNNVVSITEELDATEEEKLIKEVNVGLYCVNTQLLKEYLPKIDNNNIKNEYYLTDLVKLLSKNHLVGSNVVDYDYHIMGINDLETLAIVESLAKK